ncbi:hypothetical protein A8B75_06015 [Sphingomonadales bacterium EhC05]|nr:hypothetical protein A8B75_06015 [Sphingomonadales bacterium EhC05]
MIWPAETADQCPVPFGAGREEGAGPMTACGGGFNCSSQHFGLLREDGVLKTKGRIRGYSGADQTREISDIWQRGESMN